MLNLVQTEFLKLRRKKLVWLMLAASLLMPVLAMLLFLYKGESGVAPIEFYRWVHTVYHFARCPGGALHDADVR